MGYRVKRKTSRQILFQINKKYPRFPFTIRNFDEKKVKFGIKEIADHELVNPYPSVHERDGELVCQTKFTALLLPSGTERIKAVAKDGKKRKHKRKESYAI